MTSRALDRQIGRVISRDACSGCGACTLLDPGLEMAVDDSGYLRPKRVTDTDVPAGIVSRFTRICPGLTVSAPPREGRRTHPTMGSYVEAWQAWATDPELRHRGSSGGALSALAAWLVDSGRAHRVTGAAAASDPRRTVPVTIQSREEALRSAGSRYAPVAGASNPGCLDSDAAAISKPCEAAALRALHDGSAAGESPLLLSFFCAGTPSAAATDKLLRALGVPSDVVPTELWYRGRGWPGEFTARVGDKTVRTSYDESWGQALGPTTQWRCKICVDGVGESADIVAADFWKSDDRGYPVFDDADGISALIARTRRGQETVRDAIDAGVLTVEPLDIDQLAAVQPLQVERRQLLAARLTGSVLAGRRPPHYRGFGLFRLARKRPRMAVRALRGTAARVRRARRAEHSG